MKNLTGSLRRVIWLVRRRELFVLLSLVIISGTLLAFKTTEGYLNAIGADTYRRHNLTGAGVKIGVIDMGYADLPDELKNVPIVGEDPKPNEAESTHGKAMLEIIHAIAPDAELIACRYTSFEGFYTCVDKMIQARVTLINHSAGIPVAPTRENHPWTTYVEQELEKLDNPPLWINAAGNFGNRCRSYPLIMDEHNNIYLSRSATDKTLGIFDLEPVNRPSTIFVTSSSSKLDLSLMVNGDEAPLLGDGNYTRRYIVQPQTPRITVRISVTTDDPDAQEIYLFS